MSMRVYSAGAGSAAQTRVGELDERRARLDRARSSHPTPPARGNRPAPGACAGRGRPRPSTSTTAHSPSSSIAGTYCCTSTSPCASSSSRCACPAGSPTSMRRAPLPPLATAGLTTTVFHPCGRRSRRATAADPPSSMTVGTTGAPCACEVEQIRLVRVPAHELERVPERAHLAHVRRPTRGTRRGDRRSPTASAAP